MNKQVDELYAKVLNEIRNNASKSKPIKLSKLNDNVGLSARETKRIISDLRNDYPIVAKETEGGGYWIAESNDDIIEFIQMITRRRDGYDDTIQKMNLFLVDNGDIPTT